MSHLRSFAATLAVAALGTVAVPAFGAGTPSNTLVTNSVSLNYQVNGFAQAPVATSASFLVDRALRVVVATQDANVVKVVPGQTYTGNTVPALNFDVTNTSNATVDLLLGVVNRGATDVTGFTNPPGNTSFTPTQVALYLDNGSTPGQFDPGDTAIPAQGNHWLLAGVAPDTPRRVLVVGNVPVAAADGDQATYTLAASVASGGSLILGDANGHNAPGQSGAIAVVDDPNVVQDVFADVAASNVEDFVYNFGSDSAGATQDVLYNGQHADSSAFVINAAKLYIGKTSEVIWDPINLNKYSAADSNTASGKVPKAIPGAVVMFAIGLSNDATSQAVTSVGVADDLPATVTTGTAQSVNVPDTVSITLNGSPVVLDIPNGANLNQVGYRLCSGATGSVPYTGNPSQEVSVSIGACSPNQTSVVVYFVTIP